jgi:HEAT repeat protein
MFDLYQEDMSMWSEALSSMDGVTRQVAREQLVDMGPPVVPLLNSLLEDERDRVRWEAALALKELADPTSAAPLVGALEDPDRDVRWVAAEALAGIGEPGLRPLLTALVHDADSLELREGAHLVISCLDDPDLRLSMDPLREALDTRVEPEVVMTVASRLLQGLGERPVPSSI